MHLAGTYSHAVLGKGGGGAGPGGQALSCSGKHSYLNNLNLPVRQAPLRNI